MQVLNIQTVLYLILPTCAIHSDRAAFNVKTSDVWSCTEQNTGNLGVIRNRCADKGKVQVVDDWSISAKVKQKYCVNNQN